MKLTMDTWAASSFAPIRPTKGEMTSQNHSSEQDCR
eukprot:CAMPEP_0115737792 /NCGR_PEP_ID=MMETSP0272-20121206/88013_1 /TAXON_ID=71861 /ORGANISM="Scrippsiella trochoidea, Strain CCMP3099" /LENGTH=35 /DNA_ID= /DNA_START= /DNA_END= /DNA_ORIENTATION=